MAPDDKKLRIGSFNLNMFGKTKARNMDLIKQLARILQRYDVVAVQEIMDLSSSAFAALMEEMNSGDVVYEYEISPREGIWRREESAIIFRRDRVALEPVDLGAHATQWTNFQRYPFGAIVRSLEYEAVEFLFVAVHLQPANAVQEMENLYTFLQILQQRYPDILIGGDFNASGQYASQRELDQLSLRTDPSYTWLIGDGIDTTVARNRNAYDRLITFGQVLRETAIEGSATAFRFWEYLGIPRTQAAQISDHLPVEVQLNLSGYNPSTSVRTITGEAMDRRTQFLLNLGNLNPFRNIPSYDSPDDSSDKSIIVGVFAAAAARIALGSLLGGVFRGGK